NSRPPQAATVRLAVPLGSDEASTLMLKFRTEPPSKVCELLALPSDTSTRFSRPRVDTRAVPLTETRPDTVSLGAGESTWTCAASCPTPAEQLVDWAYAAPAPAPTPSAPAVTSAANRPKARWHDS